VAERETALGICHFGTHEFTEAISHLKKADHLDPREKKTAIYLARSYAAAGRTQEGIDLLKGWMAKAGDDVDVLYWAGKLYDQLSAEAADRMTKKHPNHYLVYQMEGDRYLDQQQYENALEAYGRALADAPGVPGVHFNVANVYWRILKLNEAQQELEKELKTNPYHAQANYELGDIYVKRGDFRSGIPYLKKALALDPNLVEAHRSLGRGLILEKKYDQAIREFSLVAQADKSDHTIHALLASTYRKMGRLKEAEEETRTYEKLVHQQMTSLERLKTQEKAEE
jgi:tetratricopeptide (TPR) repeat protein